MFRFLDYNIYKKAQLFHSRCKTLIKQSQFDQYANYQLARASFSIVLNIAEGYGKFSKADQKNYFVTARASTFGCVAILDTLRLENFIDEKIFNHLAIDAEELSKVLYLMIQKNMK